MPFQTPHASRLTLLFALFAIVLGTVGCAGSSPVPRQQEPAEPFQYQPGPVRHVIHISVDGLRPDAITRHDPEDLPNFYRLRAESAFTDNARTDVDYGNTLPNHMAQLTGRPVTGDAGHGWTSNSDPAEGETLHTRRGAYTASVFDVVHDRGLRTGAYASKSKFVLLDQSYNEVHGAPDTTGADNGRDKIDTFVYEDDTEALVNRFVQDLRAEPYAYSFLHLRDPDVKGHKWGWRLWGWHPYMRAVRKVDDLLGRVFEAVESDPRLAGHTVIILTADHGGSGHTHGAKNPAHYTIPFYVWGAGVRPGDLYAFNAGVHQDPGADQPGFDAARQPIRNGSASNLALSLLDLDPVPGSTINLAGTMQLQPPAAMADGTTARSGASAQGTE